MTETDKNNSTWSLKPTDLRNNSNYVKYYSLITSGVVMVLIPGIVLFGTFIRLHQNIPEGKTKRKILRILGIIMILFLICHVPKVRISNQIRKQLSANTDTHLKTIICYLMMLQEYPTYLIKIDYIFQSQVKCLV